MQLPIIIAALRQRCPSFANRVAGAAEYKILPESQALNVPCAYVVPLDESPGESRSQNNIRQMLNESFAVVVALSNRADEKGQGAVTTLHTLRAEIWAALLGWRPEDRYDGIVYEGAQLLALDRCRLWYQFEFSAQTEIGPADGWQDRALAGLPHFDGIDARVDLIDPHDPNRAASGPDGRIEAAFSVPPGSAKLP